MGNKDSEGWLDKKRTWTILLPGLALEFKVCELATHVYLTSYIITDRFMKY